MKSRISVRKRLLVLALLALGGCEMLAKHAIVQVESEDHSPLVGSRISGGPEWEHEQGKITIGFKLPFFESKSESASGDKPHDRKD